MVQFSINHHPFELQPLMSKGVYVIPQKYSVLNEAFLILRMNVENKKFMYGFTYVIWKIGVFKNII